MLVGRADRREQAQLPRPPLRDDDEAGRGDEADEEHHHRGHAEHDRGGRGCLRRLHALELTRQLGSRRPRAFLVARVEQHRESAVRGSGGRCHEGEFVVQITGVLDDPDDRARVPSEPDAVADVDSERARDRVGERDLARCAPGRRPERTASIARAVAALRVLGPDLDAVDRPGHRHEVVGDHLDRSEPLLECRDVGCALRRVGLDRAGQRAFAEPKLRGGDSCELYAAVAVKTAAATTMLSSTSTRICWRHSRRNMRTAQRTIARRPVTFTTPGRA